ncbi:MAG: aldehyde dehydrogenase family protein [Thermaerobacter sp.]|nr:aldehyde dehydrogenase family protein [Thermaerobacter sp.]
MEAGDRWLQDGEKLLLIDGRLVPAADGGRREVIEPATGAPLATVATCGSLDALQALGAARAAADDGPWTRMSAVDRIERIVALSQQIAADALVLARIEARDSGRPLREAQRDVRYAAALALREAQRPAASEGRWRRAGRTLEAVATPVPLGVVVVAAGAHAPLRTAIGAIAPALAAGNCVIVLPDVRTPLSALRVGELARAAGLPQGVLQVLSGGRDAGAALAAEAGVDLVVADLGMDDQRWLRATRDGRPIRFGPSAKGTLVVLNGADPAIAADHAMIGACYGQGALPWGLQRIIAQRKLHDHLVLELISRASSLTLGNPIDPDCELGPVASEGQREVVEAEIAAARTQGATLVYGGTRGEDMRLAGGFYLQPALLVGLSPEMSAWRRDVAGPILLVHEAQDADAALAAVPSTGPVGVFGVQGVHQSRLDSEFPGRDIWQDSWNLAEALGDPHWTTWRQEDFTTQRTAFRAPPSGTGWYLGGV